MSYRLLDHTADLGFRCEAPTREELFAGCAQALADVMVRTAALDARESVQVSVKAPDDPARLRAFLEETLFLFESRGFLVKDATVRFEGDEVHAELRGQSIDLATHAIERVVKAVTYHGLAITRTRKGLRAQVILDL